MRPRLYKRKSSFISIGLRSPEIYAKDGVGGITNDQTKEPAFLDLLGRANDPSMNQIALQHLVSNNYFYPLKYIELMSNKQPTPWSSN